MGNFEKLGVLVIIILVVVILVLTVWGFNMPADEFVDDPGRPPELQKNGDNGGGGNANTQPDPTPRPDPIPQPDPNPNPSPWPVPVPNPNPNPNPLPPQPVPPVPPVPNNAVFHIVKDGETLWSIAKQYLGDGKRSDEIQAMNPGVTARNLSVGTRLEIPSGAARARPAPDARPLPGPSGDYYVVKDGDNLWRIAKELLGNGTHSAKILAANRDVLTGDGSNLHPGMRLKIPR